MVPLSTTARVTLATAATLTALVGYASAADLRGRAPVPYQPPPPPPPVFNWSGCYIGGYVGGAWNERDAIFTDRGNSTFRAFSGGIVGEGPRTAIPGTSARTAASSAAVLWAVTGSRSARRSCSASKVRRAT